MCAPLVVCGWGRTRTGHRIDAAVDFYRWYRMDGWYTWYHDASAWCTNPKTSDVFSNFTRHRSSLLILLLWRHGRSHIYLPNMDNTSSIIQIPSHTNTRILSACRVERFCLCRGYLPFENTCRKLHYQHYYYSTCTLNWKRKPMQKQLYFIVEWSYSIF